MKKILAITLILITLLLFSVGCAESSTDTSSNNNSSVSSSEETIEHKPLDETGRHLALLTKAYAIYWNQESNQFEAYIGTELIDTLSVSFETDGIDSDKINEFQCVSFWNSKIETVDEKFYLGFDGDNLVYLK